MMYSPAGRSPPNISWSVAGPTGAEPVPASSWMPLGTRYACLLHGISLLPQEYPCLFLFPFPINAKNRGMPRLARLIGAKLSLYPAKIAGLAHIRPKAARPSSTVSQDRFERKSGSRYPWPREAPAPPAFPEARIYKSIAFFKNCQEGNLTFLKKKVRLRSKRGTSLF
jgi:hypothetical protein